ncbi:Developmentally regulated MAPK interacting protein, partial [Candidatus Magnetomorum sp. HK-1]
PDVYELASIVDLSRNDPAIIEQIFPNIMSAFYWSSTSNANCTGYAWGDHFNGGYGYNGDKSSSYYVRAVREGQDRSFGHLVINDNRTVTDLSTGLMWDKQTTSEKSWFEALSACENSHFAGFTDWRLPTREELRSIVSYHHFLPSINSEAFQNTLSALYWSSTSNANYTGYAWGVHFNYGSDYNLAESSSYYVRAVRGGQYRLLDHLIIWSPNQASNWETGNTMPIRWSTSEIPGNVNIYLSRQGGKEGTFELIAEKTPNDGEYDWHIEGNGSVNCMLKIVPLNEPDKWTQQSLFMITDFVPQNPISNSHTIHNCNSNQTIDIEWSSPEVWGRKIQGYAILWDHSLDALPEKQITTVETIHTSQALAEGNNHYVHIRVVDDQGHWSNTAAHIGPFCIKYPDVSTPQGLQVANIFTSRIELKWYLT